MRRSSSSRRQERGFALLVIFLIAAAVAFTMYQELPRAAFESARDKEQLLMDRGNQYKRAIQVFYAENKRYPVELKDLDSTANKRYLRRHYIDPMTGQEEWRLIHTNGSFLTDSLVKKPPAQNANGGLPGQGQTPGGGPLGANTMNTAPAVAPDAANNSIDPATGAAVPVLNPMAQQRPSDRRYPAGPGFPQPPAANPGAPAVGGANSFGMNSGGYDPSDPRTWPPITIATPAAQSGQVQQPGPGGQPVRGNQAFGSPAPGAGTQQTQIQPNFGLGQSNGQGGGTPQPSTLFSQNSTDPNAFAAAPITSDPQNMPQPAGNPSSRFPPVGNQPSPAQQPPPGAGQAIAQQAANLGLGGFNPQAPPSQQPNPALPGNNTNNAALNAIDNALFRPNQAPATGPTGSPGIAGVASKFKGPSIKAYRERTKYQEWEFVYEPTTNQPGANQPAANPLGAGQPGQTGAPGQSPLQAPNPFGPASAQPAGGAAPSNPFSMPNPFGPGASPAR
jgi:hypothetical protein